MCFRPSRATVCCSRLQKRLVSSPPFPIKLAPRLSCSNTVHCHNCSQLVRTFHVLDLEFISAIALPCPGLAVSYLPPTSVGFAQFASDPLHPSSRERARYSMIWGKEGYDSDRCPWMRCDANSEEEKGGGLGFGHGRSRQMRVTIFETACPGWPFFSPSSYVFFFIYFPERKAYLLSRMHPIP
jgi:hypothetical protein